MHARAYVLPCAFALHGEHKSSPSDFYYFLAMHAGFCMNVYAAVKHESVHFITKFCGNISVNDSMFCGLCLAHIRCKQNLQKNIGETSF